VPDQSAMSGRDPLLLLFQKDVQFMIDARRVSRPAKESHHHNACVWEIGDKFVGTEIKESQTAADKRKWVAGPVGLELKPLPRNQNLVAELRA